MPVVGLDSLRYFWKERTPRAPPGDVDLILRHYLAAWDKQIVVLIGYSQGADILPFVVNRLPAHMRTPRAPHRAAQPRRARNVRIPLSNWLVGRQ
jgi:type IV secretory pathway VirJ component